MKVSAGLVMCRRGCTGPEMLLAHPGGPFFARKDEGAWSIPKGLVDPDEEPLDAARREFYEETGIDPGPPDSVVFHGLGLVRQKGGKRVHAWAFEGDCDPESLRSQTFAMEWPPRSGRMRQFPEVDRFGFFAPAMARRKLLAAQVPLLDRLTALVRDGVLLGTRGREGV